VHSILSEDKNILYWIVSPKNEAVTVYKYEDKAYGESTIYTKDDVVKSEIFKEFSISIEGIFE